MSTSRGAKLTVSAQAIPFDDFWRWLQAHPHCILNAATPDVVIYDDDDLHWHLGNQSDEVLLVQLLRGKRPMAELLIEPEGIAYVQVEEKDDEEFAFECMEESPEGPGAVYTFTLSHGYNPEEAPVKGRYVH